MNAIRRAAAVLALALAGCGPSARDAMPNPDLKIPDIPPGGHGSKDAALTPAAKNKKTR